VEKKLRAHIARTSEWHDARVRMELARELRAEGGALASLVDVLEHKHLRLAREWRYCSNIWQHKHASRPSGTQSSLQPQSAFSSGTERLRTITEWCNSQQLHFAQPAKPLSQTEMKSELIAHHAAREWRPPMERAFLKVGFMGVSREEYANVVLAKDDVSSLQVHSLLQHLSSELERMVRNVCHQHTVLRSQEFTLSSMCDLTTTSVTDPMVMQHLTISAETSMDSLERFVNTILGNQPVANTFEVREGSHDIFRLCTELRQALV
jgi:hypothetical protein